MRVKSSAFSVCGLSNISYDNLQKNSWILNFFCKFQRENQYSSFPPFFPQKKNNKPIIRGSWPVWSEPSKIQLSLFLEQKRGSWAGFPRGKDLKIQGIRSEIWKGNRVTEGHFELFFWKKKLIKKFFWIFLSFNILEMCQLQHFSNLKN